MSANTIRMGRNDDHHTGVAEELNPLTSSGDSGVATATDADSPVDGELARVLEVSTEIPTLSPAEARQLDQDRYQLLTTREKEVLQLVGQGYSAPEIGARL